VNAFSCLNQIFLLYLNHNILKKAFLCEIFLRIFRQDGNGKMALSKQQKQRVTKTLRRHDSDTGSAEYQIALFSEKIKKLVSHLKKNPKDKHSRRGLLGMVQQRKKLMQYLKSTDEKKYGPLAKINAVLKSDKKCRPCNKSGCRKGLPDGCISDVKVEDAFNIAKLILKEE